jgi:hypothetical protein
MYDVGMSSASGAPRDRRFNMLLSEQEERMLRTMAEADGLTASDLLRQMIRREFLQRWPPKIKTRR